MEEEKQTNYNDRLDVFKDMTSVKTSIKDKITSDFVFACLSEKDKLFIIEMTVNAYYSRKLLDIIVAKSGEWKFINNEYKWVNYNKESEEYKKLDRIRNNVFNSYMNKIFMIITVNRNVAENHLIKILANYKEEEENGTGDDTNKLKELLADQSKIKEK